MEVLVIPFKWHFPDSVLENDGFSMGKKLSGEVPFLE